MPSGGTLTIRGLRQHGECVLEIQDTGHGIQDDEKAKIFRFHYSTKDSGSGVGLSIVKMITEYHGDGSNSTAPQVKVVSSPSGSRKVVRMAQKIIIIDDDMLTRVSTADLIKSWGYEVETAASFNEGLKLVNEAVPDIAIIDLRLPDGDGMELLSLIREQHPQVDAVILTGHASIDSAIDAIKKGAENYLKSRAILIACSSP